MSLSARACAGESESGASPRNGCRGSRGRMEGQLVLGGSRGAGEEQEEVVMLEAGGPARDYREKPVAMGIFTRFSCLAENFSELTQSGLN